MTYVYTVSISQASPFDIVFKDESNDLVNIYQDSSKFNALSKHYFGIDTKHDFTSQEAVQENNKAITDACLFYADRFKRMKFMLINKKDFKDIRLGTQGPPDIFDEIEVTHLDTVLNNQPKMKFREFVTDVLSIDIGNVGQAVPVVNIPGGGHYLEMCPSDGNEVKRNFYQMLLLYDIHDMFSTFPDGRSSISFHIDSATSDDSLSNVPNICNNSVGYKPAGLTKYNIFDIAGFVLPIPGANPFINNNKFSLLYFGDLMIAYHYRDLPLNQIVDLDPNGGTTAGFDNFDIVTNGLLYSGFYSSSVAGPAISHFDNPGVVAPHLATFTPEKQKFEKLCKYSLLSLNIFWQTLLTYIHSYMILYDNIDNERADHIIHALRHWVFVGINYKDTKPSFNGKFIKRITRELKVNYIAYWFIYKHHYKYTNDVPLPGPHVGPEVEIFAPINVHLNPNNGAPNTVFVCRTFKYDEGNIKEFEVTQGACGLLVNKIYSRCNEDPIAIPRKGARSNGLSEEIERMIFDSANNSINDPSNYIIIGIAQVLKFSGDMSHKTAAMMYKNVFSTIQAFKNFTPCITTTDRPLFTSFFMDNLPGIITGSNTTIVELSSITTLFSHTAASIKKDGNVLVSFYLPKLETNIFDFIRPYFDKINDYSDLLNKLYSIDPVSGNHYEIFTFGPKYLNARKKVTYGIIKNIYEILSYLTTFYLSFFSSNIIDVNVIRCEPPNPIMSFQNNTVLYDGQVGGPTTFTDYRDHYNIPGNRINYAWFAYYRSIGGKIKEINFDNLNNHRFIGFDSFFYAEAQTASFIKNIPFNIMNIPQTGDMYDAPQELYALNTIMTLNYPNIFVIDEKLYKVDEPAVPTPGHSMVHQYSAAGVALPAITASFHVIDRQEKIKHKIEGLYKFFNNIYMLRRMNSALIQYNARIEKDFIEKMDIDRNMGGLMNPALPPPPIINNIAYQNFDLKNHYKKYYVKSCQYDNSLLVLATLYDKLKKSINTSHKYVSHNIFSGTGGSGAPGIGVGGLLFDDPIDSLFIYRTLYFGASLELKTLEARFSTWPTLPVPQKYYYSLFDKMFNVQDGIALHLKPAQVANISSSVFNLDKMIIRKYVAADANYTPGYYLFPFLDFTNVHNDVGNCFVKKMTGIISPDTNSQKARSKSLSPQAQKICDILSNFTSYISDFNSFFVNYRNSFDDERCVDGTFTNLHEIFEGTQCQYIIYSCLLFFNFKCNFKLIQKINSLFISNLNVGNIQLITSPPSVIGYVGVYANGKRDKPFCFHGIADSRIDVIHANNATPIVAELLNDPSPEINVIGLFTDYFEDSNTTPNFNPTLIKGAYFIINQEFTETYNDLKGELIMFLKNYKYHFLDSIHHVNTTNLYSSVEIL